MMHDTIAHLESHADAESNLAAERLRAVALCDEAVPVMESQGHSAEASRLREGSLFAHSQANAAMARSLQYRQILKKLKEQIS
jgi:hypothetical protein